MIGCKMLNLLVIMATHFNNFNHFWADWWYFRFIKKPVMCTSWGLFVTHIISAINIDRNGHMVCNWLKLHNLSNDSLKKVITRIGTKCCNKFWSLIELIARNSFKINQFLSNLICARTIIFHFNSRWQLKTRKLDMNLHHKQSRPTLRIQINPCQANMP